MSRRNHHGGRHHGRPHRTIERRPGTPSTLAPGVAPAPTDGIDTPGAIKVSANAEGPADPSVDASPEQNVSPGPDSEPLAEGSARHLAGATPPRVDRIPEPAHSVPPMPYPGPAQPANSEHANGDGLAGTCTAPQLRRFIKSRAYVPMHELRRRFAINGSEDDVTQVDVEARRIYIGLPEREGRMLGELLRGGDVGFELSMDPITPIVVGVYPMRPVPRP